MPIQHQPEETVAPLQMRHFYVIFALVQRKNVLVKHTPRRVEGAQERRSIFRAKER